VKYLVDTSALVRIYRRQVDDAWYDVVNRGQIAVCEPTLTETLTLADAKSYGTVARFVPQLRQRRVSSGL
jgi:predicted nucleic acid-binding protein